MRLRSHDWNDPYSAAGSDDRYYWDEDNYDSYWLSPRCLLDEEKAADYILGVTHDDAG